MPNDPDKPDFSDVVSGSSSTAPSPAGSAAEAKTDRMYVVQGGDSLRQAKRLEPVDSAGAPRRDRAEPARACAHVAEDHEGRCAGVPALADVGTARFLADGV